MSFALPLLLGAALLQSAPLQQPPHLQRPSESAVRLTITPIPAPVLLGGEATVEVSVTNVSSVPQYLSGDTLDTLQYAVRDSSGRVLRGYSDPPPPPRMPPVGYSELIWLPPGKSLVFYQHMPLSALGIFKAGAFRISGALSSYIFTEAQWKAQYQSIFFTFAPWVTLEVVKGRSK